MAAICPPPCSQSCVDERILHIHQSTCSIFLAARDAQDKRAMEGESALELKWKRKKRKLMETSQPEPEILQGLAGPSTEPPDIEMPLMDEQDSGTQPFPELKHLPTPPLQFTSTGRPIRTKRKTWKLLQQLPEPALPVTSAGTVEEPEPSAASEPVETWIWKAICTTVNGFGLFREYPSVPTYNPDQTLLAAELSDIPGGTRSNTATIPSQLTPFDPDNTSSTPASAPITETSPHPAPSSSSTAEALYTGPFPNWSTMSLMVWQWTGSSTKSIEEAEKLVDIIQYPNFSKADIMGFDMKRKTSKFDEHLASMGTSAVRDGWKSVSVDISVPDGKKHASEADAPIFSVPNLFYRPLVEVIKSAIRDAGDRCFHYTPFKQFWTPTPGGPSQRVYDEIYSSEAMVEVHTALQNQPREPGCTLERVILSLMFWSDSTHLASFGDASLWPLYLFFGNQSKWLRVKLWSNIPDAFHDFYKSLTGKAPTDDILTHCCRDLMHAIWRLLRDYEFLEAWEHGIVIGCEDGILRRFYLRIFTYSADYPEKVLLATIRNLGKAPCPRCYLLKEDIPNIGTVLDDKKRETLAQTDEHVINGTIRKIRDRIYKLGCAVKSTTFDFFLLARSWTPTSNAFSDRLGKFAFNPFKMLVVDFMHEFELGVFKGFFIHLLRILFAYGNGAIGTMNERFQMVPTFGQSTIRRFTSNTSALKKMAAWNYQAILLCSLPVIEGLIPDEYNSEVLDMLFALAEWHTLVKLKMHTDYNSDDPAVKDFMPKLQEHLLSRLAHPDWIGDGNEFTSGEHFKLTFASSRMYGHKILCVNYTSYDVRCGQDCLNPRTHSDVMVLAPEGDTTHPFSFVDRNMYMRYRGGGVGHYQVPIPPDEHVPEVDPADEDPDREQPIVVPEPVPTPEDLEPNDLNDVPDDRPDSPPPSEHFNSDDLEALHSAGSTESEDSGSKFEGDGYNNDEKPDLGPEDGEGNVDEEVAEGYAAL
ncbi:hypothetical protein C8R43DRAFT_1121076 [Mycena crocata]|nr:hypothetical protein C8R43DRAFT_1121076 [Mycena crocata]